MMTLEADVYNKLLKKHLFVCVCVCDEKHAHFDMCMRKNLRTR